MQQHILFSVLILSSLLLSSCKTAPFAGRQDIRCAQLIIKTDNVSITHETVKETADTGTTDTENIMIGRDITENAIISIKPSDTLETDEGIEEIDMTGIKYVEDEEDTLFEQDSEDAAVSVQPFGPGEPVEKAVKEPAVEEIKDAETYLELAAAYSSEGKYEEALEAYQKASDTAGSGDPEIHYNLGLTYLMLDDRDSALKEYKILKGTNPLRADTLYRKTVEKILSGKDNKFTVQTGAYKNINYAYKTIKRLQKNYIYAYIKKENNFNKVRIPGIKTRKDGEAMIKELRKKFGFRSVLLNAPEYP